MARPIRKGLDYFPLDINILENMQIRKLKSRYKAFDLLIYLTILYDVYKNEGYFLRLSDDYMYDLSDRADEPEERVVEVIGFCLRNKLFNRQKFDVYKVLTPTNIQAQNIHAQKRCKNTIRKEFDCINEVETTENTTESAHIILGNPGLERVFVTCFPIKCRNFAISSFLVARKNPFRPKKVTPVVSITGGFFSIAGDAG